MKLNKYLLPTDEKTLNQLFQLFNVQGLNYSQLNNMITRPIIKENYITIFLTAPERICITIYLNRQSGNIEGLIYNCINPLKTMKTLTNTLLNYFVTQLKDNFNYTI